MLPQVSLQFIRQHAIFMIVTAMRHAIFMLPQVSLREMGQLTVSDSQLSAMISECQQFAGVVGAHHFSGSWLGLDGTKATWIEEEVRV